MQTVCCAAPLAVSHIWQILAYRLLFFAPPRAMAGQQAAAVLAGMADQPPAVDEAKWTTLHDHANALGKSLQGVADLWVEKF